MRTGSTRTSRLSLACVAVWTACLPAGCGTGIPGAGTVDGATTVGSAQAVALEQLALELINRARLRPTDEANRYGIDLNEGVPLDEQISGSPKQPLALNASLTQAARSHSQDMLTRNYFDHDSPEGVSPFDRMTNAGYLYAAAGENLAMRGTPGSLDEAQTVLEEQGDLFVDVGIEHRGHRTTMLNGVYREVGVGILRGFYVLSGATLDSIMQTQDYGASPSNAVFVLGTVYNDTNANGQYDFGEGTADVNVTLGGVTKTTNAGGGYSFEVRQAGVYTLQFSGGPSRSILVSLGDENTKIDLVNGAQIVVNLGIGSLN